MIQACDVSVFTCGVFCCRRPCVVLQAGDVVSPAYIPTWCHATPTTSAWSIEIAGTSSTWSVLQVSAFDVTRPPADASTTVMSDHCVYWLLDLHVTTDVLNVLQSDAGLLILKYEQSMLYVKNNTRPNYCEMHWAWQNHDNLSWCYCYMLCLVCLYVCLSLCLTNIACQNGHKFFTSLADLVNIFHGTCMSTFNCI